MPLKFTVLIAAAAVMAGAILVMRQDRLELSHQIAVAHRRIDQARHGLWDQQARIAGRLETRRLLNAIERSGVHFEPLIAPAERSEPKPARAVLLPHAQQD